MKAKAVAVMLIAMFALFFSTVFVRSFATPDGYDLLIIAPDEFVDALQRLKDFKDATNRPTLLLSLEGIYSEPLFDGADEAEEVKKCIAHYKSMYGDSLKYVMLVGDCDKFPTRTFYVTNENATHVNWLGFYLTDHYYADLFNETGGFCDWDYNKNGLYGECKLISGVYTNLDHLDLHLDVAVGRVAASSVSELNAYIDKIIQYETTTSPSSPWFKRALLLTGTDGGRYEPPSDISQNDAIASKLASVGFVTTKLYNASGYDSPNPTRINDQLNLGVGFVNTISHADRCLWGYCYDVRTDMGGLGNAEKLPVIYSFGCFAAGFGPFAPHDPYIDIYATTQPGGYVLPRLKSEFVVPPKPSLLQIATDMDSMAEYWLVKDDVGGIAFIGSTAEAVLTPGYPLNEFFFDSFVDGKKILGDIWLSMGEKYLAAYDPYSGTTQNWEYCRRWLFMNTFGDPSLAVGGLSDKPPTTTKTVGPPSYEDSFVYVTSSTPHTLIPTDDSATVASYYRYYPEGSTPPPFELYTGPFVIEGDDGPYIIEYYSIDDGGNWDFPIKSQVEYLDNTPPTTTLSIGTPQYSVDPDIYVTSATTFNLIATDDGSGVAHTYYRISAGPWSEGTLFTVTGLDGTYDYHWYSIDNLGNTETINSGNVILDNTPPETTLTIGSPRYTNGGNTYVTTSTPFTLTASDGTGSGVLYTEYRINPGSWTSYIGAFTLSGPDGTYVVDYRSTDNLGNVEPTSSETVILDNTPPEVEVVAPPDGYVYGQITFTISASDYGSCVNYVEYSLDESTWVLTTLNLTTGYYEADWDTSSISDGDYTVYSRAFDNLGNEGRDPYPPEVTVVHLELSTRFTDSKFNPIEQFDAIFSPQKPPMYKLSTNPGTFYEIIEITNTGSTVTLPRLVLNVSIPTETYFLGPGNPAFKLLGAKPVHIYLNGVDVTPVGRWLPDLDCLSVEQALSPGDTIKITIHYEYAFKGNLYSHAQIEGWTGEDYDFETTITDAFGPSWAGTLRANKVMHT